MSFFKGLATKGSLGTMAGYMAGRFCLNISDVLIWYGGLTGLFLGGLHWMNWVTVNFEQIDADVTHIVYKAKEAAEESGFMVKIQRFISRAMPLLAGLSGGFYMGFFGGSPM